MVEKIALHLFWVMMICCAASAFIFIWTGGLGLPEEIMPTFFILGFASFLFWAPLVVYRFLEKMS